MTITWQGNADRRQSLNRVVVVERRTICNSLPISGDRLATVAKRRPTYVNTRTIKPIVNSLQITFNGLITSERQVSCFCNLFIVYSFTYSCATPVPTGNFYPFVTGTDSSKVDLNETLGSILWAFPRTSVFWKARGCSSTSRRTVSGLLAISLNRSLAMMHRIAYKKGVFLLLDKTAFCLIRWRSIQ